MGNIETMTQFSRLKSISSIEDNYSSNVVIYFFLHNYKGKLSVIVKN